MRPFLLVIGFFVGNLTAQTPVDFRMWTDLQQRKIEAALERIDGDKVVLKMHNGDKVSVPLTSLSESDRIWAEKQRSPDTAPADGMATARSRAAVDWPRTVALKSTPVVEVIREDPKQREYVYETEHYEFICDSSLGANLVREFSRIFEATRLVNCLLPLDFKPEPEDNRKKFRAHIFTHLSDYHRAGGPAGSGGVYSLMDGELKLPLSSLGVKMFGSRVTIDYSSEDYRTLIHEITHQMMNRWIVKLPTWYAEGSAEYVELAKYENGRFSFLQQDKRLRDRLLRDGNGTFYMVPLEKLMTINSRDWLMELGSGHGADSNYASAAALTYYFYHLDDDGKGTHFKDYIREVKKLKPLESDEMLANKYLLRGRDYAALQKEVQKGLRRVGVSVEFSE